MILRTKTTKMRKKKRFNTGLRFFWHPNPGFCRLTLVRLTLALAGVVFLSGPLLSSAWAVVPQSSSSSHAHDFVIFTTVFTEKGFALPGARVRVRRADEKKFRWEATSDQRGEFAVRVPQDADYEMTVEARGYKVHVQKVDATEGNRADLTIRMEPQSGPHSDSGAGGKS